MKRSGGARKRTTDSRRAQLLMKKSLWSDDERRRLSSRLIVYCEGGGAQKYIDSHSYISKSCTVALNIAVQVLYLYNIETWVNDRLAWNGLICQESTVVFAQPEQREARGLLFRKFIGAKRMRSKKKFLLRLSTETERQIEYERPFYYSSSSSSSQMEEEEKIFSFSQPFLLLIYSFSPRELSRSAQAKGPTDNRQWEIANQGKILFKMDLTFLNSIYLYTVA